MNKLTFILVLFGLAMQSMMGQEQIKEYQEVFKVSKSETVTLEIDASFTDVIIETWSKHEIKIDASMKIDSLGEQEAQTVFDNWNFEALGNSTKVKVSSFSKGSYGDHYIFTSTGNSLAWMGIEDLDISETIAPLVEVANIEIPNIVIPEIVVADIELPEGMEKFEIMDFDFDKHGKDSMYMKEWSIQVKEAGRLYKEQMEAFKNSENYQVMISQVKEDWQEAQEEVKKQMEQIKVEVIAPHEEKIALAKKEMQEYKKKVKTKLEKVAKNSLDIKKTLRIKVPENVKFELKVKHGKLSLPASESQVTASVNYGQIESDDLSCSENKICLNGSKGSFANLNGGSIEISNSKDVEFESLSSVELFINSSKVEVGSIGLNVVVNQDFGKLYIGDLANNLSSFTLSNSYGKSVLVANHPVKFMYKGDENRFKIQTEGEVFVNRTKLGEDSSAISGYILSDKASSLLTFNNNYGNIIIQ
ncbi:MAG: hypothetical protein ACPGRE_05190 [Flavobacteriaceae bacterium]